MSKKIKTLYDEVLKLRNRLSNDGSGEVFEEDHLLLDCVLDLIEKEMKEDVIFITLNELETLLMQSKAGIIPIILRDFRDNPIQFQKYLTMRYPVEEILADWA